MRTNSIAANILHILISMAKEGNIRRICGALGNSHVHAGSYLVCELFEADQCEICRHLGECSCGKGECWRRGEAGGSRLIVTQDKPIGGEVLSDAHISSTDDEKRDKARFIDVDFASESTWEKSVGSIENEDKRGLVINCSWRTRGSPPQREEIVRNNPDEQKLRNTTVLVPMTGRGARQPLREETLCGACLICWIRSREVTVGAGRRQERKATKERCAMPRSPLLAYGWNNTALEMNHNDLKW